LGGAAEVGKGAGDHPGQGDGDKPAATERHNRAQQWRLLAGSRRCRHCMWMTAERFIAVTTSRVTTKWPANKRIPAHSVSVTGIRNV